MVNILTNTIEKMTNSDIMMYQTCMKPVELTHQCKTENGIEKDENLIIFKIIGAFEQLVVENQYGQLYTVNPNQVLKPEL